MVAGFFTWWLARTSELLPKSWTGAAAAALDGIVIGADQDVAARGVTAAIRHKGGCEPVTLGVAARLASRKTVFVRPPPEVVLKKHYVAPTAPRRELNQLLRYELARITPFMAEDLFWRWDGAPKSGDKARTEITLTMVPKAAITATLDALAQAGIRPSFVEIGSADRPRLLPIDEENGRSTGHTLVRALAWSCAGLAVIAMFLPVLLQELDLRATNAAIDGLQPAIRQVEALRRGITADGAAQEVLGKEMERTGDVLQVLATVTRILPDDTYLTDFALHDRQMTLGGRSASAARLIAGLSSDPAVRDAGFAAPVTRLEGATTDVFSIRAGIAP